MSKKTKKPLGMIIAIIVLAIIVIALGISLLCKTNPLDEAVKKFQKTYPDYVFSAEKLSGAGAQQTAILIKTYCPDFNLDEYYLAQVSNSALQKLVIFVINPSNGKTECTIEKNMSANSSQQTLNQNLLATINNEPVYLNEVLAVYNNIAANQRTNTSMQDSLNAVVGNKLLLQDAVKKGLAVTEQEVDAAINSFLSNSGLSLQQLEQNLAAGNSTLEIFRTSVRNSLLLQKEINTVTNNSQAPTDAQIKTYYDTNQQSFFIKAGAATRQLMINANDSNAAEKLNEIKAIASMLNATNFCELVTKYSEDTVSVQRCGEYDFQEGQLLPEYEQVVFNSTPGTTKLLSSRLGYHIVQIINITLPRQLAYEQVKDQVKNFLIINNKQTILNAYIANLRSQATIVSYLKQ